MAFRGERRKGRVLHWGGTSRRCARRTGGAAEVGLGGACWRRCGLACSAPSTTARTCNVGRRDLNDPVARACPRGAAEKGEEPRMGLLASPGVVGRAG